MQKGFTLIEILVSVALFAVVVTVALGALLAMSVSDRKAEALKSVINNLDFAVDSMSRAIRTGSNWSCGVSAGVIPSQIAPTDCNGPAGGNIIVFTPAGSPNPVAYQYDTVGCANGVGCLEKNTFNGVGWNGWVAITAPEVILTQPQPPNPPSYLFHVWGTAKGAPDNKQPTAVITLTGYAQVTPSQKSQFQMQTSATQRIYDQ